MNIDDQLEAIQRQLNSTFDDAKHDWNEFQKYNDQLKTIEEQNDNMELGGVKIKDLNKSLGNLTTFLGGAFNEINKSVHDMNNSIEETKKELHKQSNEKEN